MLSETVSLLRCPICRGALSLQGGSLVCKKRHCYDVARQGHVNFAPAQKDSFYTKQLFESRAQAFAAGVFEPVIAAIEEAARPYLPEGNAVLVDAGCGEGYYTGRVCREREMTRIGFDLSKEAVRLAAKGQKNASFFVADLANIPLRDGCADVLLDVFTPANYAEFARVLRPQGVVIKLAPRSGYLRQLREAAAAQLRRTEYDGGDVERYAHERMEVLAQRAITYTLPVGQELAGHLARMTPMLAGVDIEQIDLSAVHEITIDETLYVGRVKA